MEPTDSIIQLEKAGFDIDAIKIDANNPFTWASGFKAPIYNDNRKFLGNSKHRILTTKLLELQIWHNAINYDMVLGTSTAGIAPAASLANKTRTDLTILHENKPFLFSYDSVYNQAQEAIQESGYDAIATTSPLAIPFGVMVANENNLPFMYVRQSQKKHGLENKIEGLPKEGQRVLLLNYHIGDTYNGKSSLEEAGMIVEEDEKNIEKAIPIINPYQKNILTVEDLVSTSGSALDQMKRYRELGATADNMVAIFSYNLPIAEERAKKAGVNIYPAHTFNDLIKNGIAMGKIDEKDQEVLQEWTKLGLKGWHDKYGK